MRPSGTFGSPGPTAGRILELLRHGPMTIDDLASTLGLTRTAVRAQITLLMTRGSVEPAGVRKSTSKPARLFAVTAEAEQELSRAYVPVLTELLYQLGSRLDPAQFEALLDDVGRGLGRRFPSKGILRERVEKANAVLRELGGLTTVTEESDRFVILGQGCPLSAATGQHPETCAIIAGLIAEVVGQSVTTCCQRYDRKRCCFEILRGAA
jgi:predicted ArsR family transcriptional regulator